VGAITATVPRLAMKAGRRADEHQVLHGLRGLIQSGQAEADHHAHLLLAAVHIGGEQLDQPLFGFQSQQHLAHPLAVNFCGDKVGHAVNKNGRSGVSSGQRALAGKAPQPRPASGDMPRAPTRRDGQLRADALDGPSAKISLR